MYTLAISFSGLALIALIFVRRNSSFSSTAASIDESQLTVSEALCQRQYWVLVAMDFCTLFPLLYMASVYKIMGMQIGNYDDNFLTIVSSIGAIANGLSRVVWGYVQDMTGFRTIYKIVLVTELFFCTLVPYVVKLNGPLYLIMIFLGNMCLGAHFVIFPNCIVSIFGLRSSVQLSSLIYVARCVPAFSGMFISKALVNAYGEATYSIMFYTSSILVIISFLLLYFI